MLASRLFWKMLLACALLILLTAIASPLLYTHNLTWMIVVVAALCVAGFGWWSAALIIEPIKQLTAAAAAIASGNYRRRVYVANRDELGAMAQIFERMSHELDTRITQLLAISDRQSTVLDGMIEGVIAIDARQRIVLANPAAGGLFDFDPQSALDRPLLGIIRNHPLYEAVLRALANGESQHLEIRPAGPEPTYVDVHVQPLPGHPSPGLVLVMHDTTELRRLESLRRDFVANVSHELKTPLSSIKAYTETLRNGALSDVHTSQAFLARIEEESDRLNRLIMDMLTLARVESYQQAFQITSVDVAEIAAASVEDHRRAATAKRINLVTETTAPESPELPMCHVRADREGLREILGNLLDNAVKYTPEEGKVAIGWRIDGRMARIAVRDTGVGIKPDDQRRVFERFYRADKARSRSSGGTGLGLAIVKHMTQSFGGTVVVESTPGHGSTFTVSLPLAKPTASIPPRHAVILEECASS